MTGPFRRIRRAFGNLRLQRKFTLTLLLTIALPVLVFAFAVSGRLYQLIASDTIRQEQADTAEAVPELNALIRRLPQAADALQESPFYRTLFHQPLGEDLGALAESQEAKDFEDLIEEMKKEFSFRQIRLYLDLPASAEALFAGAYTSEILFPVSRIRGTYWHGIFSAKPLRELYCPPAYLGIRERRECGDICYLRPTTIYCEGDARPAYLAIYYSEKVLSDTLIAHLALSDSVSYLINDRSNLVASTDNSLAGIYYLNYDSIEGSVLSSNNFIERQVVDESVYAAFYRTQGPGWFLVTVLPSGQLRMRTNQAMFQVAAGTIIFLLLVLLLFSLLAGSITRRIRAVANQMQQVRTGAPVPMDSPEYLDEVGDLVDTYNYMTRRMNGLLEHQAKTAEDLRIAEFKSLQAQINPHFLYNTMDMIHWMAVQGQTERIVEAVQRLSRFYKLTLSRRESMSTVAQEEEHISIYVDLQNMRFGGKIGYIADIPDELLSCQIPKLTLQPVVENAILHGILEKEDKTGNIVLTGWTEGEDVVLLVSDDGVGMSPERLAGILSGEGETRGEGSNIAVYNTHRRLELLYGEGYGLSYDSAPGKGCEVQIRLPRAGLSSPEHPPLH